MLSNFTIRMATETKNKLSEFSKNESLTQGDFISMLLENYTSTKCSNPNNTQDSNLYIPLEHKTFTTIKPSNKYKFSGKLLYRTNLMQSSVDSISHLKSSLRIDNNYSPAICLYGYSIFIHSENRFLLHEIITMSSTNDTVSYLSQDVYIQRAIIKNTIEDLIEIIKYHATAQDISNIKLLNIQGTSDEHILSEYFN